MQTLNPNEFRISGLGNKAFVFDHLGIAVTNTQRFLEESLIGAFPSISLEAKILDPLQDVWVQFLSMSNLRIELLEPASVQSPVSNVLKDKTYVLHHVCFKVPNLEQALALSELQGCILIKSPLPAIALGDRKVAFVMGKDRLLWELLEFETSIKLPDQDR